jgi:hypothetical protein
LGVAKNCFFTTFVLLAFVFALIPIKAVAQTETLVPYFALKSDRYLLPSNGVVAVSVLYSLKNLDDSNFVVKPVCTAPGGVSCELYDAANGVWLTGQEAGTKLPTLSNAYLFRVTKISAPSVSVYFEIYNKKNNQTYKSSTIKFWNNNAHLIYIRRLNDDLKSAQIIQK